MFSFVGSQEHDFLTAMKNSPARYPFMSKFYILQYSLWCDFLLRYFDAGNVSVNVHNTIRVILRIQ